MSLESWKPVQREPVVTAVVNRIKEKLISGELKPGQKLPSEIELSQTLGVGRSSVREALKMLKALGVVQAQQGDGTYIAKSINENAIDPLVFPLILQPGSGEQLVEFRGLFEAAYTKLAAQRMTQEDFSKIEKNLEKHKKAMAENKLDELSDIEEEFHTVILKATKNPFVIKVGQVILAIFWFSIRKTSKMFPERSFEDHKRIFQALKARDSEKIEKAIYKSLEVWGELLAKERRG